MMRSLWSLEGNPFIIRFKTQRDGYGHAVDI